MTSDEATRNERVTDAERTETFGRSYATSLPAVLPACQKNNNSSSEGPSGIATARENGMTDTDPFLALYSINANRLVRIGSYHNRINDVMRQFRWATLERGDGWYFPEPYLARVELALCGVDITLANRDGSPTPAAAAAERRDSYEQAKRILAELHAARDAALADPAAVRDAREECRRAYEAAIAAKHPEPEPSEDGEIIEPSPPVPPAGTKIGATK